MAWECPLCKSTNLRVNVKIDAMAILTQNRDCECNFETEIDGDGDHIWDDASWMSCDDCDHETEACDFEVDELSPPPADEAVGASPGASFGLNAAQEPDGETTSQEPSNAE